MTENTLRPTESPSGETSLESWKEIAAYLKRDVRTAKRWEKSEALPVRRHQHQARSSVYAYPSELAAWLASRQPQLEAVVPPTPRWRSALALAAALVLTLISVGSRPVPTSAGAAQQDPSRAVRQVRLADHLPYGSVSPDGTFITDVDWTTGDLALIETATQKMRRLTNKGSWADSNEYAELSIVSPDSKTIAYAWFSGETYDLRLIELENPKPRILYQNKDVRYLLPGAWSDDGKLISATVALADGTNRILLVSPSDGSARVLKSVDWRWPDVGPFSRDGQFITYGFPPDEDKPDYDIFLLAVDGSREVRLLEGPANEFPLAWTSEGDRLLFLSNRTGSFGIWSARVMDGKTPGRPELVKAETGRIIPQGFTRDGSFYYGVKTNLTDVYDAQLELATGSILNPERASNFVEGGNSWPVWSPDGKLLVHVSQRGRMFAPGSLVLVVRNLKSREEREVRTKLSVSHPHQQRPSVAPDGKSVLVAAVGQKQRRGIYRVDLGTGEATLIVSAPASGIVLGKPAWTPKGESFFYWRQDAPRITSVVERDLNTGLERVLYGAVEPQVINYFGLSPDGRQVALLVSQLDSRSTALLVMPASGGTPREVLKLQEPEFISRPRGFSFTPDGREIVAVTGRNENGKESYEFRSILLDGGQPRRLGLPMLEAKNPSVHPGGKRIAFAAGENKSELWVMENFLPAQKAAR